MRKVGLRLAFAFVSVVGIAQGSEVLFVSSGATNAVLTYDSTTGASVNNPFVPSGSGGLAGPEGLAFGPNGNLFVASQSNQVLEYNGNNGTFVTAFVTADSGGLNAPFGLTFGPNGNLFVASNGSSQVLEYNGLTGAPIATFVSAGSAGLAAPRFVVFNAIPTAIPTPEPDTSALALIGLVWVGVMIVLQKRKSEELAQAT